MAKLILTGEFEAIDLKALHGDDILELDTHISDVRSRNGGFADIFIELRRGICTLLRINESYPLRARKQKSA